MAGWQLAESEASDNGVQGNTTADRAGQKLVREWGKYKTFESCGEQRGIFKEACHGVYRVHAGVCITAGVCISYQA